MSKLQQEFIQFSVNAGVLRFGEFITKAGRKSPYFFNAGLFNDGATLSQLADFYAQALLNSGVEFDMLFGPAYKGITLVAATSIALAKRGGQRAIRLQPQGSKGSRLRAAPRSVHRCRAG